MEIHRTMRLILAVAVALAITWTAASGSASAARTIHLWLPEPPSYTMLATVVKEEIVPWFEAETGLTVEVTSLTYLEAWRRLQMQQGPDVLLTLGDLGLFMGAEGWLMPLDRFIQSWDGRSAVPPELLRPQFQTGEVFALPILIDLQGAMVYNKDLFGAAGLDPERPPDTWVDLEEAVRRTTRVDGEWLRPGLDMVDWSLEWVFRVFLYQAGGRMWSPDHRDLEFHSRFGIQAAEAIAALYQAALPETYRHRVANRTISLPERVAAGDIAMAFGRTPIANRNFYALRGLDVSHLGLFVAQKDHTTAPTALVASSGIAISSFSNDPQAAWQFIDWMFRPDVVTAFHNRFAAVVPRTDLLDSGNVEGPLFPALQSYLSDAVASPTLPSELATRAGIFSRADGGDTADLRRDLMRVYLGELDAETVLQSYAVTWQQRLDQAWEALR